MDEVDRATLHLLTDDELAGLRRALVRAYDKERWQPAPDRARLATMLEDTRTVIAEQRSRQPDHDLD